MTVIVTSRPLDTIKVDSTFADVASPDPGAALFAAFNPVLRAVRLDEHVIKGSPGNKVSLMGITADDFKKAEPALQPLLLQLQWIEKQQVNLTVDLDASAAAMKVTAKALDAFRKVRSDQWPSRVPSLTGSLADLVTRLKATAMVNTGSGQAAALKEAMEEATKAYAAFSTASSKPSDGDLKEIGKTLNEASANQSQIDASSASLVTAATAAHDAADVLSDIDPMTALTFRQSFGNSSSHGGRSVAVKLSRVDVLSKESADLATVTAVWTDTRWEVSAGALFSKLVDRTFTNTADIVDGKPQTDDSGKVTTTITESDRRPTVVPFAFAHFRLWEGAQYDRRFAVQATGGMGVNPYSGSADFAVGGSFSYRSLVFSLLRHYGRDSRLSNGLMVGQSLGTDPPDLPVARFWKWSTAFAVSARLF